MDCSTPGFPVLYYLPELAQTHVHWVRDVIQPSHSFSVTPFSSCPQSFPASGSSLMSQLFTSGGQNFGVSASASVLPTNIQGWFSLGLTGLISLLTKVLSRVFSSEFGSIYWRCRATRWKEPRSLNLDPSLEKSLPIRSHQRISAR